MINQLTPQNIFSALLNPYKAHTTITESDYKNEHFNAITIRDKREQIAVIASFQDTALTINYYERGSKLYDDVFINPTRKELRNKINEHLHYLGVITWEQKKKLDL